MSKQQGSLSSLLWLRVRLSCQVSTLPTLHMRNILHDMCHIDLNDRVGASPTVNAPIRGQEKLLGKSLVPVLQRMALPKE